MFTGSHGCCSRISDAASQASITTWKQSSLLERDMDQKRLISRLKTKAFSKLAKKQDGEKQKHNYIQKFMQCNVNTTSQE